MLIDGTIQRGALSLDRLLGAANEMLSPNSESGKCAIGVTDPSAMLADAEDAHRVALSGFTFYAGRIVNPQMNYGIVGHEAAKFSVQSEARAREIIRWLLSPVDAILVSGACHLGGVDIWAEEIADSIGREKIIHAPKNLSWSDGYKPRNLLIAQDSDVVHVIVVATYPEAYTGMRFDCCYHCHSSDHVKSGACWTAKRAQLLGKKAVWHVL